jgi:hypothetical protein
VDKIISGMKEDILELEQGFVRTKAAVKEDIHTIFDHMRY